MNKQLFRGLCAVAALLLILYGLLMAALNIKLPAKVTPFRAVYGQIEQGSQNLFFIETSCIFRRASYKTKRNLTARQACAIESAARMNPNRMVYLLDSCLSTESEDDKMRQARQELTYGNVRVLPLDLPSFLAGTPLDSWLDNGKLSKSKWPVEHASDVARLVALWKYGGVYMDLDVIVLRSLDSLGSNFVGAQSEDLIATGVMGFTYNGYGHEILDSCLEELRLHYKGDVWIHNGPALITRVLKEKCKVTKVGDLTPERCHGLTVYPKEAFYKIPYQSLNIFFVPTTNETIHNLIAGSFIVHFWNKLSYWMPIRVGSNQTYGVLASQHCPRVYWHCGEVF